MFKLLWICVLILRTNKSSLFSHEAKNFYTAKPVYKTILRSYLKITETNVSKTFLDVKVTYRSLLLNERWS